MLKNQCGVKFSFVEQLLCFRNRTISIIYLIFHSILIKLLRATYCFLPMLQKRRQRWRNETPFPGSSVAKCGGAIIPAQRLPLCLLFSLTWTWPKSWAFFSWLRHWEGLVSAVATLGNMALKIDTWHSVALSCCPNPYLCYRGNPQWTLPDESDLHFIFIGNTDGFLGMHIEFSNMLLRRWFSRVWSQTGKTLTAASLSSLHLPAGDQGEPFPRTERSHGRVCMAITSMVSRGKQSSSLLVSRT